jgi:hypothetical protein
LLLWFAVQKSCDTEAPGGSRRFEIASRVQPDGTESAVITWPQEPDSRGIGRRVWAVIRPFDHYAWAGVRSDTLIEDGKAGDQVGAVRRVSTEGGVIRQVLLAHSDAQRSYTYTYALCDPAPFPVRNDTATVRVAPVVDGNRSFVEGFAKWLAVLREFMALESSKLF